MSLNLPKRAKRLRQRDPEEEEAKKTKVKDADVQGILDRKKQRREMDKELERVGIVYDGQVHEINSRAYRCAHH